MSSSRPPCRCEERRQAMRRATAALARGDVEAWRMEKDFVLRTSMEDARAYQDWLIGRDDVTAERLMNIEDVRMEIESAKQLLLTGMRFKL